MIKSYSCLWRIEHWWIECYKSWITATNSWWYSSKAFLGCQKFGSIDAKTKKALYHKCSVVASNWPKLCANSWCRLLKECYHPAATVLHNVYMWLIKITSRFDQIVEIPTKGPSSFDWSVKILKCPMAALLTSQSWRALWDRFISQMDEKLEILRESRWSPNRLFPGNSWKNSHVTGMLSIN